MPRWNTRSSPPSSAHMMNFPRRVTASTVRPGRTAENTSGTGKRRTFGGPSRTDITRRPTTAARRSRATVSTSGSSGTRRLANGCHLLPVLTDLDVDNQRNNQLGGTAHGVTDEEDGVIQLLVGHLEHELVVHLEQQPRAHPGVAQGGVAPDHR